MIIHSLSCSNNFWNDHIFADQKWPAVDDGCKKRLPTSWWLIDFLMPTSWSCVHVLSQLQVYSFGMFFNTTVGRGPKTNHTSPTPSTLPSKDQLGTCTLVHFDPIFHFSWPSIFVGWKDLQFQELPKTKQGISNLKFWATISKHLPISSQTYRDVACGEGLRYVLAAGCQDGNGDGESNAMTTGDVDLFVKWLELSQDHPAHKKAGWFFWSIWTKPR